MAHSSNQNQLKLWGPIFFNDYNTEISPKNSLRYWVIIHKRILLLKKKYPNRVLLLNFESLCSEPDEKIKEISLFCGENLDIEMIEYINSFIEVPSSIGRYKNFSFDSYNVEDIDYIKKYILL